MAGTNYYAVSMVFPVVTAFIDRNLGFVERTGLTRMGVLFTETIQKVLFNHRGVAGMECELKRLRSEI